MKKLFTIVLIGLYLFNISGYFLFYKYYIHQSDQQLINQIDDCQYEDSELIEVKIPLHLPYMTSWATYERADGELQHKGAYYNYVKRKISNDTLYLLYVPNVKKTNLFQDLTEYSKKVNGIPGNEKNSNSSIKKLMPGTEYTQHLIVYEIPPVVLSSGQYKTGINTALQNSFIPHFFKPPRFEG